MSAGYDYRNDALAGVTFPIGGSKAAPVVASEDEHVDASRVDGEAELREACARQSRYRAPAPIKLREHED